ncbi:metal ABC transporter substrate-binding protein [uncultured Flavonifractor sp.]|uniref:metal ABC transporter substrate-binding protein n=1 Tax=uncultured Flavonifractor sp. TaxID=1193534 RepID=UPI0026305ACD|nr:metal ABC transporter substrate-binding protein [uncultured Flavonifractor sp.]
MKKLLAPLCALGLLLSACGQPAASQPVEDDTLHILATTYPVYLFTTAVTEGADGVEVSLLVNQQTSCLHDYTLTVADMKAIEGADVIVMNGAGLEDFMDDALSASSAQVIDCSEGMSLLPAQGHEGHDHDTEYDPHIWMDATYVSAMLQQISQSLTELDSANGDLYTQNESAAQTALTAADLSWREALEPYKGRSIVTFHDGFQYFANALGLTIFKAIEEEEGSTASAQELAEIVDAIKVTQTYELGTMPIFTEVNGSTASADTIAREVGCQVYQLDLIMSGDGTGLHPYLDAMQQNVDTLVEALG